MEEEHQLKGNKRSSTSSKEAHTKIEIITNEETEEEEEDTYIIHVHKKKNEEGPSDPMEEIPGSSLVSDHPSLDIGTLVNNLIDKEFD
jgi:hypothetical protein